MDYSKAVLLFTTTIVISSQFSIVQGGSCWEHAKDRHYAEGSSLRKVNVTREQCCQLTPAGERYYSEDEPPQDQTQSEYVLWRYVSNHKVIMACQDGCTTFARRCTKTEVCKVRPNQKPKCVCNPYCSRHHLSRKGRVCGDDGKTYRNHCQLRRQNCRNQRSVQPKYFGQCKPYSCDGVTCVTAGDRCTVDQYNRPTCLPIIPIPCGTGAPICATNNQSFDSLCHMTRHKIESGQPSLLRSYHGACSATGSCHTDEKCKKCLYDERSSSHVCITTPAPECSPYDTSPSVCGNDSMTYKNECTLRFINYNRNKNIVVQHIGSCGASIEEILQAGRDLNSPDNGNVDDDIEFRRQFRPTRFSGISRIRIRS